ncbi:DUF3576 domain-containing protein [Sulfitobacter sp. LCG007]
MRLWPVPVLMLVLAACGQTSGTRNVDRAPSQTTGPDRDVARGEGQTIWSLFNRPDYETQVQVNRYLWDASLEVLDFLPVETVDPFTGVIVTGYGRPPGGGNTYRATVLISDPALDARSLNVAIQTSGGGSASPATIRAVEDAILNRARQLRISDNRL